MLGPESRHLKNPKNTKIQDLGTQCTLSNEIDKTG